MCRCYSLNYVQYVSKLRKTDFNDNIVKGISSTSPSCNCKYIKNIYTYSRYTNRHVIVSTVYKECIHVYMIRNRHVSVSLLNMYTRIHAKKPSCNCYSINLGIHVSMIRKRHISISIIRMYTYIIYT